MSDDDVPWLVDEMRELLDVGDAGIYEFVEALRQRYPDTDVAVLRPIAREALTEILNDVSVRLAWYEWPKSEPVAPASTEEIRPETFDAIGGRRYLGIKRV
jgi:hypothetical protein